MVRKRLALGCALAAACALMPALASAQDSATAGALFEKGVADMEAGHFDSACPAIEESERIDPRPGTQFTLAECNAHWGKVASAVAQYQEYVDVVSRLPHDQQLRHKARADIARAQLAKLKPTVPTLTLVLPPDAPAGTFATRNGEVLKGAALGLALPVDPGDYVIVTHAPGAPEHETKVSVQLGEAKRVPLEAPKAADTGARLAPSSAPAVAPGGSSETVATPPEPGHGNGRKTAAYVAGGVGIAGVALGTISGILVFGKKNTVNSGCTSGTCTPAGLSAANSGKNLALVSDIGFGVGIAGLAVGTILLLSSSSSEASAARSSASATAWQPVVSGNSAGLNAGLFRRW